MAAGPPAISVIMANYCGADHIDAAIRSVLGQTLTDLELIVSDDASPDDSLAIARNHATRDPRVVVIEAPANAGPAAARNRALDAARGAWIAIVDSDDLIHPQRLERMLAAATALGVDMVADDLLFFGDAPDACGRTLLQDLALRAPLQVDTRFLLRAHGGDPAVPPLGYLKPLIRAAALDGLRYDEALQVGEDYDLCLRLLFGGARYALIADPMYLYRRHSGSISHRLSQGAVAAMIAAHDSLPAPETADDARERAIWRSRLEEQQTFERLVELLKGQRAAALPLMLRPAMARRLTRSVAERLRRRDAVVAQTPVALHLSSAAGTAPSADALRVAFPPVPAAGAAWPSPPAAPAAELSALSALHDLRVTCADAAGRWAAWLLPSAYDRD